MPSSREPACCDCERIGQVLEHCAHHQKVTATRFYGSEVHAVIVGRWEPFPSLFYCLFVDVESHHQAWPITKWPRYVSGPAAEFNNAARVALGHPLPRFPHSRPVVNVILIHPHRNVAMDLQALF